MFTFPFYCLSLVTKKIVELHGGTVSVVSAGEGEGSTFTVRLPCVIAPDSELNIPRNRNSYDDLSPSTLALVHPSESLPTLNLVRSIHCPQLIDDLSTQEAGLPIETSIEIEVALPHYVDNQGVMLIVPCIYQGLNVLVVDDSSMTRKMVCKILRSSKQCICEQAADGAIAVDMIRQRMAGRVL